MKNGNKMKRLFLFVFIASLLASCGPKEGNSSGITTDLINNSSSASGSDSEKKLPVIEFDEMVQEFGTISQGEKVKRRYKFKNVGNADLIISNAQGSCGCTVPLYPKHPIKPGEEAEIEVVFDSNGKKGHIHNTVGIIANTNPNKTIIALKGDVITPDH